jgi:uncharacterized RDD family membrane protein YckC
MIDKEQTRAQLKVALYTVAFAPWFTIPLFAVFTQKSFIWVMAFQSLIWVFLFPIFILIVAKISFMEGVGEAEDQLKPKK